MIHFFFLFSGTRNSVEDDVANEESWETEDDISYHTLNLPREKIQIIDTVGSFQKFLDNDLKHVQIVGIDSEWKPTFSKELKNCFFSFFFLSILTILYLQMLKNQN